MCLPHHNSGAKRHNGIDLWLKKANKKVERLWSRWDGARGQRQTLALRASRGLSALHSAQPRTNSAEQPRVSWKLDFGEASEDSAESASYTDTSNHSTPNSSPLSSPVNSPRMRRVGDSAFVFTSSPVAPRSESHLTLSMPPLPRKKSAQLHLPMTAVQSQDSLAGLLSPGRAQTNSGRLERLFSRFRNKSATVVRRASKKSPQMPRAVSDEQLDHFYQRFACAFTALAQNESSKKIVR